MQKIRTSTKDWIVPIQMQALYFTADDTVKEKVIPKAADFKKMPYRDSADMKFYNNGPNIGERLLRKPFEASGTLEMGVHLHWSLPFILTHAEVHKLSEEPELNFPKTPNRWLVCRQSNQELKYWLVESDLLFDQQQTGTNVTVPAENWTGNSAPYRHLGRVRELTAIDSLHDTPRFDLTAVGYGDPTFSAVYTNCQGVFGIHDTLEGVADHESIKGYTVIGWYHNIESGTAFVDVDELKLAIEKSVLENEGVAEDKISKVKLENLLYQGTLLFKKEVDRANNSDGDLIAEEVNVGVGNTAAEAMSAISSLDNADDEHLMNLFNSDALHVLNNQDGEVEANKMVHQDGFSPINGGVLWVVNPKENADEEKLGVNPKVETELKKLNAEQRVFNKLAQEIEHYRFQLFGDWYKYLLVRYLPHYAPQNIDLNDIMAFMDEQVKSLYQKAVKKLASSNKIRPLKAGIKALLNGTDLELKEVEAPRFWQAQNPVVAIELKEHLKNGSQRTAGCLKARKVNAQRTSELDDLSPISSLLKGNQKKIFSKLIQDFKEIDPNDEFDEFEPNFAFWSSNSFTPVLLDWKMMYHAIPKNPDEDQNNRTAAYKSNFFLQNYELRNEEEDAVLRREHPETFAEFYSGSIILTESAGRQHQEAIEQYFSGESGFTSPLVISQAMSGFNDALLMNKEILQVDVNDTMAANVLSDLFSNKKIREAIADYNDTSPLPFSYFSPIRCGALSVAGLRLIDQFGRIRKLKPKEVNWSKGILAKQKEQWLLEQKNKSGDSRTAPKVPIRPRITQPARLLFRWLMDSEVGKSVDSLVKSPIQGWIVPNFLDHSLEIYNPEGRFLYTIRANEGGDRLIKVNEAESVVDSLRKSNLTTWIDSLTGTRNRVYLTNFLKLINQSLQKINPAIRRQYQDLAALMGRPMALTRASFELELYGAPAINQSWDSFKIDIDRNDPNKRDNNGLLDVEFPIRLGEVAQASDGLVGYFLEEAGVADYTTFYSQSVTQDSSEFAKAKPEDLTLKINKSFTLTMLVDPMAKVNATMGILPSKSIEIPSALFTKALENMEVNFFMNPVLTHPNMVSSADDNAKNDSEVPFYLPLPGNPELAEKWTWQNGKPETSKVEDSNPFESIIPDYIEFTEGYLKLKL